MSIPLDLSPEARHVVRQFANQLLELLDGEGDPEALKRLFPPAYAANGHEELEAEYRRLMGDDLRRSHRQAAETLLATIEADELDDQQAEAWLKALNELRLVVGTMLDVSEEDEGPDDPSDPRASGYALYHFLTALQGELIEELSDRL